MCGIIGYLGDKNAKTVLIEGLRALEYRGYDSAGLAVFDRAGEVFIRKTEGKVKDLERYSASLSAEYSSGIAHTRWATHGEATGINAHPHTSSDGRVILIHNGIIENYMPLKKKLESEGARFQSETDTEVIAELISKFYESGRLIEAVASALANVQGSYGLAVMARDMPGTIVGARNGSPLVVGIGDSCLSIASDRNALPACARRIFYLDDGELVHLGAEGYRTISLANVETTKEVEDFHREIQHSDRAGYPHYMLKEIFEQPGTIADCYRGRILPQEGLARLGGLDPLDERLHDFRRIIITACGTSWHAALVGEYLIEELAGIAVEVEYASEFRYRNPIIDAHTLVLVISQSGETADTLAALREAKMRGAAVAGIVNATGSTIAREAGCGIYVHAGLEKSVASTKAFTSQVIALFLFALRLARMTKLSSDQGIRYLAELVSLPRKIENILNRAEEIRAIAGVFRGKSNCLYLGRGIQFPVALEGALKLKEVSYIHAEGYPAAEMKHGPIALIEPDMPVVVVASRCGVYEKVISNIEEIRARRGMVIAITTEGNEGIRRHVDHVFYIPEIDEALSPILTVIPLQLLAYYIAVAKGHDPDMPRNLAKSVTVE
ncbi:MAG: glutamine--fructose-6-phosphate transaminase (isomerizing) [Spirochaetota bacterium]|jgi:glucosamine--fructose-6-phosphate aminotransferase (isomerizing)|nr:glutamine--fructose-6-phosphate transaminase (isomerizing) [Spirochaetota bacterium]